MLHPAERREAPRGRVKPSEARRAEKASPGRAARGRVKPSEARRAEVTGAGRTDTDKGILMAVREAPRMHANRFLAGCGAKAQFFIWMKRKLTLLPDYGSVKRKRISSISTTTTNSTSIFSESPISAPETDNSNDPLIPLATIERTLFQATSHTPQSRPSCSQNSIRSMEPSSILPELWTFSEWRYPNDDEWSKMSTEKQRKTWPKYARRKREIKKLKHFKWFNKDVDPMPRGVRVVYMISRQDISQSFEDARNWKRYVLRVNRSEYAERMQGGWEDLLNSLILVSSVESSGAKAHINGLTLNIGHYTYELFIWIKKVDTTTETAVKKWCTQTLGFGKLRDDINEITDPNNNQRI
ncbi:hypothetical protein DdX_02976 [Ditylenchus destructor]|uniref:Uncharacterized protein n=1 Tax=Ditylenchus destructor TaxID=166010 RepID=A0AAD4NH50_9BILA|nr:hypothetical protein DdX_02976 [Ditylenchus destructor]